MLMVDKRRLLRSCAALAATACAPAWAQVGPRPARPASAPPEADAAWPTRPVQLLVGFPPNASPDTAARIVAAPLARLLGQPVDVANKPGASGNVAADAVAKARDDHTLGVLINGNLTIARLLDHAVPFDPEKDFAPIGLIGTAPLVLATSAKAQGHRPDELLLWARNLGADARYGTPGAGTVGHLGMELLKMRTSISARHQPFAGNPQVVEAMLAGQIELALLPPGLALPAVKDGRLKAIGITAPERSPLTGGMPTLREADVRGADLEIWTALAGPAGQSTASVARMNAALQSVLRTPEVRDALLAAGWQARGGTPEALVRRIRSDTATLGGVIMMRGIRAG
ncbi:tripartite tricarboxylate transporter substrate binding protein [uncultured Pseudacidovorax sp.]|uniref:Bug family tripartite tricarboxylate transporter substrate binding protein n=1 Tax=uncultured Pseudacidovorax sp. TaxID=679313 RepID=UPI0025CE7930|nr:tripartite tricarboxylate transporter substrate binding protein [uncultured Pseudacidovorax sp.]